MSTADELLARKNATIKALDNTISSLDDIQKETKRLHSIAINTTNTLAKVQPAGAGNVKENLLHKIQGK